MVLRFRRTAYAGPGTLVAGGYARATAVGTVASGALCDCSQNALGWDSGRTFVPGGIGGEPLEAPEPSTSIALGAELLLLALCLRLGLRDRFASGR